MTKVLEIAALAAEMSEFEQKQLVMMLVGQSLNPISAREVAAEVIFAADKTEEQS